MIKYWNKKAAMAVAVVFFTGLFSCVPKQDTKSNVHPVPLTKPQLTLSKTQNGITPPKEKLRGGEQTVQIEKSENKQYIELNFDNADLETVISRFGEILKINYMLSPGISGKVTIQSYRKFPVKDLFSIFQSILEINGLAAVKDGPLYRIVPIESAKRQPTPVGKGERLVLDSGYVTQLIPLDYVKASDVAGILRDLMPRGTDVIIYEPANLLIVTSTPQTLIKFMKIISALDVSDSEKDAIKTFVYYVENGDAKKLADIVKTVYSDKNHFQSAAGQTLQPYYNGGTNSKRGPEALTGGTDDLTVTPYEELNALVINCSPRTYLSVLKLLKRLDVAPKIREVLIDVLEAEVKLGPDESQLGLEWLLRAQTSKLTAQGGFTSGGVGLDSSGNIAVGPPLTGGLTASGLTLTPIGSISQLGAFLTLLQSQSRLNVLASPHVLALNNKEAKIDIGDEVPIATGLTQQPSATISNTLVSAGQIQYKTIGKLLSVTPNITDDGQVSLKLSLEVSDIGSTVPIAGQTFQAFTTKKATTTAVVQSGHTLLIGGLMSESKQFSRSGIPILSDIPLLGYLFSTTTQIYEKDELIVLVTPYVVFNQEEADALTAQFRDKIKIIKKRTKRKT